MVFPKYNPTNLEWLVKRGDIIIEKIEKGETKKIVEEKSFQDDIHKYQKLFEFLEDGYKQLKEEPCSLTSLDETGLFNDYECITSLGMFIISSDTIKLCNHLKYSIEFESRDHFCEEYIQKTKELWSDITKVRPEHKRKIELMKHFNKTTAFIGRNKFYCNDDSIYEITFDFEKDKWKIWENRVYY